MTAPGNESVDESPGKSAGAAVVIPARLQSLRFPRKVLARETGKFLIQHVYESVQGARGITRVIVATDSEEVLEAVRSFGGEARMTAPDHACGTDRVAEVARSLEEDRVINVQGDEPEVDRDDLTRLARALDDPGVDMATLARPRTDREGFLDPNQVKVVCDGRGEALYFSRAPLPHPREAEDAEGLTWLYHIGVYAFRREYLEAFTGLPRGRLESIERLEQLRALENGTRIRVIETSHEYAGIDTPEEYRTFVERVRSGPPQGVGEPGA